MAREDAVLDGAPVKREAHVRAAVVRAQERPRGRGDDEDRAMGAMHDESAFRLQVFRAPCKCEVCVPARLQAYLSSVDAFSGSLPESAAPLRDPKDPPKQPPQTAASTGANMGTSLPAASGIANLPARKATSQGQDAQSRQVVLVSRPSRMAQAENFAIREATVISPADGQILVHQRIRLSRARNAWLDRRPRKLFGAGGDRLSHARARGWQGRQIAPSRTIRAGETVTRDGSAGRNSRQSAATQ